MNLNVKDQDAAKAFWTETMGFELVLDNPMGDEFGARWIEVRSPGQTVTLVLFAPEFDESKVGRLAPAIFTCDDIQATHKELTARGVEFPDAPAKQFWGGRWATFKDKEGNLYGLGQREPDA